MNEYPRGVRGWSRFLNVSTGAVGAGAARALEICTGGSDSRVAGDPERPGGRWPPLCVPGPTAYRTPCT